MQKRLNTQSSAKKTHTAELFSQGRDNKSNKNHCSCFFNCYDILNAGCKCECAKYVKYLCGQNIFVLNNSIRLLWHDRFFQLNKKASRDFQWHAKQIYSKVKWIFLFVCYHANETALNEIVQIVDFHSPPQMIEKLRRRDYFKVNGNALCSGAANPCTSQKCTKCE